MAVYKRHPKGWTKHLDFIILDMLCLCLAGICVFALRHDLSSMLKNHFCRELLIPILLINFMVILFGDTMKNVLKRGLWKELSTTVLHGLLLFLCISAYLFNMHLTDEYSRLTVGLMILAYITFSYALRIFWKKKVLQSIQKNAKNALLLMCGREYAEEMIQQISERNYGNHKIVGVVVQKDLKNEEKIKNVPIVADYENVIEYVTRHWVDDVMIHIERGVQLPEEIIDTLILMGITVHFNLDELIKCIGAKQTMGYVGGQQVVSATMNYMTPKQFVFKRALDIAGGVAGCIITGILYLFLAPAIKRESPGPVFFTQERIGRNGKPFKIYKFRSMYLDAEERKAELMKQNRLNNNFMFKMDFDPRVIGNRIDKNGKQVTGIGEFIRKYSLDEFPQFYNVLKGDMSMIGTRPPLVSEYNEYSSRHKARLAAKPGITGLWQVSGRSNILDFEEVVKLDTEYINNWSIGLDLKILFKTVMVVLKKEGSM